MYTVEKEDSTDRFNLRDINDYEEAISKTGYGKFNRLLLFLCGWGLMSDSIEVFSSSFILPPATCDLNLSSTDKALINSSSFLGMVLGSFLWGLLSDRYGRRRTLVGCLGTNAVGGIISSLVQHLWTFVIFRFISGIGVGGSMPVLYAYYGEFQSKESRGSNISSMTIAWPIGTIFAAGLAWFIIPYKFGIFTPSFIYSSWRVYLTLCTIPAFTCALSLLWMPESPKFLIDKGRETEAMQVLQKVNKMNHPKKSKSASEVFELNTSHATREPFAENSSSASLKDDIFELGKSSLEILRPPVLKNTLLLASTYSCYCFGYYGLFLWLPEIFKRIKLFGGSPCSHEYSKMNLTSVENTTWCPYNDTDTEIYFDTFVTAASAFPTNILTILLIDIIGRRAIFGPSLIISGSSVFLLYAISAENATLITACIFSGFACSANVCQMVLGVELFPTDLRSTGAGFMYSTGRIAVILGNVVFGLLIDSNCAIPLSLVATVLCTGGVLGLFIPDYRKRDIH